MPDNCTFLIYVAADEENTSGARETKDEILESHLPLGVHVVMQVDRPNADTRRFVRDGQNAKWTDLEDNANAGRRKTLRGFLEWGIEECPARNTCLTVWGHGNGALNPQRPPAPPGPLHDAHRAGGDAPFNDPLTIGELRTVLERFGAAHRSRFDVVAFHSCLMGAVEVAFELSGVCRYLVAAEDEAKQTPWSYAGIFEDVTNTSEIARSIVENFGEQSAPGILAAFDQAKIGELASTISTLGDKLCRMLELPKNQEVIKEAIRNARDLMIELGNSHYVDLGSTLDQLARSLPSDDIRIAVTKVKAALNDAVVTRASVGQVHAGMSGVSIHFRVLGGIRLVG